MANAIELKSNVRAVAWAAAALVTVGLSACGGGGTTGEVVTGRVMDGYINGASVCFDTNANGACDPGEPMAETADGGVFTMTVPEGAAGQPHMLVDVPVGAVDLDDPENPIQAAYKMRGLVAASAVISPLTTMQAAYIDAGMSPAEAAAQVKTDLRLAELAVDQDYVAAGNVQTHNVARVLAGVLQAAPQMTATELRTDLSKLAATVAPAFDSLTPISNADVEERVNDWVGTNRPSAPTAGATAPTVAAANVLSIYSDTYTSPAGVNLNPGWGQATVTTQEDLGDGKVVKMVGLNYQGIELPVQNITAYSKLHVDIWSAAAGSVNLGLITSAAQTGGDAKETQVAITLQAGWNSVELDLARFTAPDLSKIDQLIWVAEGSPTIYYDNLYFWGESVGGGGSTQPESPEPAAAPTEGAPEPGIAAANVLSIYSDAYTSLSGVNLNPGWGQATVTTQEGLADGSVVKMAGLNYQGIELPVQNVSAYSKLHVDVWSPAAGSVKLGLITSGDQTGGDAKETQLPITLKAGWNSVNLDLSSFTAPDMTKIDQLIWVAEGSPTLYYDNLYFWGEDVDGGGGNTSQPDPAPSTGAPTPSVAAANVLSVYSDAYTPISGVNVNPGWGQATVTTQEALGTGSVIKMAGLNYQGIEMPVQDVSAYSKLHVDVWSPAAGSVKLSLITSAAQAGSDTAKETQVSITLQAGWNSVELNLSDFTAPDMSKIDQLMWVAEGSPTLYYDNLYFWGENVGGGGSSEPASGPSAGALAPTLASADVLSLYSDAYTAAAGVNVSPNWGQATVTTMETVGSDNVVRMVGLNYQGVEMPVQDVSAYTKLHVDIWSASAGAVQLGLITSAAQTGGDALRTDATINLQAGWNAVDLNLTDFTAPDLSKIDQLIWVAEGSPTIYYDNLYFWGDSGGGTGSTTPDTLVFSSGFKSAASTDQDGAVRLNGGSDLDGWNCTGGDAWCGAFSGGSGADSYAGYYYQTPSAASGLYSQMEVLAPGVTDFNAGADTGGVTLTNQTKVNFTFNPNGEWFDSTTNNFGVVLTLGKRFEVNGNACRIELHGVKTPTSKDATAYSMNLRDEFRVAQDCGQGVASTDVASALQLSPVVSAFKVIGAGGGAALTGRNDVKSGANLSVANAGGLYPTTVVLKGGISFN